MLSWSLICCSVAKNQGKRVVVSEVPACCSDTLQHGKYNRKVVLNEFVNTLNLLIPKWGIDKKGFFITDNCQLVGSFIWDITDTLNKYTWDEDKCVIFEEGHIYHFSPMRKTYSYSSIAILNQGNIKVFKAVNCPEKGDKIEDVVQYVKDSLPSYMVDEALINRVKDYRRFGVYLRVDEQTEFRCK
jgi:hypothetical protein